MAPHGYSEGGLTSLTTKWSPYSFWPLVSLSEKWLWVQNQLFGRFSIHSREICPPPLIALSGKKVLFWKWTLKLKSGWIGPQKQTVKIQVESSKEDGGIYQWWIGLCTVLLSIEVMSSVRKKCLIFSAMLKFRKIKVTHRSSTFMKVRACSSGL